MMKKILTLLAGGLLVAACAIAGTYTTNYSLYKPSSSETGWGDAVNTNFDTVDSQMKTNADDIDSLETDKEDVVTAGSLADNVIREADLMAVDSPADEECLTYETTTGDFEWQNCDAAAGVGLDTQVGFFDGDNNLSGDAGLTFNKTTDVLTAGGLSVTTSGASSIDQGLTINDLGGATSADDFIVESDNQTDMFVVYAAGDGVGVNTFTPATEFQVDGDVAVGGSNKELRFYEASNYVGFEAPALAADQIWVLPDADGNASDFLQTDGAGTLSWTAGGAPSDAIYLVTTADDDLSAEVVVGATPGGDLGGTWASPTVDDIYVSNSSNDVMDASLTVSNTLEANVIEATGTGVSTFSGEVVFDDSVSFSVGTTFDAVLGLYDAADPDVSVEGQIAWDSDDDTLRGYDGTNQVVVGRKEVHLTFTLLEPDQFDQSDLQPIWVNYGPHNFVMTEIGSVSDDDSVDYTLKETSGHDYSSLTTVEAVSIESVGSSSYYDTVTSIDHATIEPNNALIFDADATDTPDYIVIDIKGYFDADVD